MQTEKVIKRDNKYVLHTYARSQVVLAEGHGMTAAAPGFEHRCGTAQFSFGINLRGNCCAIERGRKCQRIDTYHHFLL